MVGSRLAVVCAALIAVFAVGCSTPAHERESAHQQRLAAVFSPTFDDISSRYRGDVGRIQESGRTALSAQDEDAVLDVYRALRDASAAAAEELDELEPPASVQEEHGALVENLRRQQRALESIVQSAVARRDGALTEGLHELTGLLVDYATLHDAIDEELGRAS